MAGVQENRHYHIAHAHLVKELGCIKNQGNTEYQAVLEDESSSFRFALYDAQNSISRIHIYYYINLDHQ